MVSKNAPKDFGDCFLDKMKERLLSKYNTKANLKNRSYEWLEMN